MPHWDFRLFATWLGSSVEGIQVPKLLPALGYALNTINSTAVQQMLIYQWQGNGSGITVNNTPHTSFPD